VFRIGGLGAWFVGAKLPVATGMDVKRSRIADRLNYCEVSRKPMGTRLETRVIIKRKTFV